MRKNNSAFVARYLSKEGAFLYNNDFYASAEADDFACYLVIDGLEPGEREDLSIRLAAEAVIECFEQKPSIGKKALKKYVRNAQAAMKSSRLRFAGASITVVVTNYQKVRCAWLGNSRFSLLRHGRVAYGSKDHSLSADLSTKGKLPKDQIALHEERNNLSRFLGGKYARPQVSRKLRLQNGDILALYTRGVWENCDESDLLASTAEAGNDPDKALENIERLILDSNPQILDAESQPEANGILTMQKATTDIENYTIALIFIDKVYLDPRRAKRIRLTIMILIVLAVVLLVLGIVLFLYFKKQHENRVEMEFAFESAIQYIADNNFVRAQNDLDTAFDLAGKLKDNEQKNRIDAYRKLTETIVTADGLMESGEYTDAQEAWLRARSRSRQTDFAAQKYIERGLEQAAGYLSVQDYISLGDMLADRGNYAAAEEKYLEARRLAAELYYEAGKQSALEALDSLYGKMQGETEAVKEQAAAESAAADYIVQGDKAVKEGDLTAAKLLYTLAREQYAALGNEIVLASIDEKLAALTQKEGENQQQTETAEQYMSEGDALLDKLEYADARQRYILARGIYADLGDEDGVNEARDRIDTVDGYISPKKN